MNKTETRAVSALATVLALRMAGLFLPLPVLAVYAAGLPGGSPLLTGLALGIYGLTQGLLQIAFGAASDRFGRKPVITVGLLVFAAGGIIAATADSAAGLVIGRAVQGAGAVSAAVLALTADLTRESARAPAMAAIGVTIGAMFLLSLMLAPPLQGLIGVAGIFHLGAALAVAAVAVLWWVVPDPGVGDARDGAGHARGTRGDGVCHARDGAAPATPRPPRLRVLLADRELLRLNLGAFCLHFTLTAVFVALPPLLQVASGLALAAHWKIYAPVLALSVAGMLPLLLAVRATATVAAGGAAFAVAVGLLAAACAGLGVAAAGRFGGGIGGGLPALLSALWLFFVAFNALEALLPSLVSRLAPPAAKGAALGVCQTFQFLGLFAGGALAGAVSGVFGAAGVYGLCAAVAGMWLVVAVTAPRRRLADESI
ncbi:MAG: MFS transporter [Gammaproteobacteria bacterium]|nr:MFS transporter [Gammaproteobacteria bacterium]